MLTRKEIEEALKSIKPQLPRTPWPEDELAIEALETAQQLGEWLALMQRDCEGGCEYEDMGPVCDACYEKSKAARDWLDS